MPQIPVYNKGQGTTVDLATGSLSPQASVQAFTAPGRATENFANNAQQIAFNFGQAEKKAQGDAASSDIQSKFLSQIFIVPFRHSCYNSVSNSIFALQRRKR